MGSRTGKNWKINLLTASEVHLRCHPELTDRIRNIHILALAGTMAFLSALINLLVLLSVNSNGNNKKTGLIFV